MLPSQASSHFAVEPISGATLFEVENTRREELKRMGVLRTGCREIDEYVLGGGLERGCVVGLSAEEADMGLLIGVQTVAHGLIGSLSGIASTKLRAAIITTLPASAILPLLRDVITSQAQAKLGQESSTADVQVLVRLCLERISISRVFDIEGLWEVLNELETPLSAAGLRDPKPEPESEPPESSQRSAPSPPATRLPPLRTEILDSEDESALSSSPSSGFNASPQVITQDASAKALQTEPTGEAQPSVPDIILITHFSTLLTTLFTQRDKSSAHTSLQLLSSHLRYLSRSSGPLILLLNTTTSPSTQAAAPATPDRPNKSSNKQQEKPLDTTLRSIFNPRPLTHAGHGSAGAALSRRNKPAFGLTFTQFLDLHLLCTRVPRSRIDAEAMFAPASFQERLVGRGNASFAWVVEVLLDDIGVLGEGGQGGKGINVVLEREQRWGAVNVRDGVMVVDAFEAREGRYNTDPVRLAAGFGGRSV
ncbi:uncharacterized protein BCR38DRAFT_456344 [Pseudomassariella vexata]|uniref:Uncharacterized protein n=1 Tax=Pseudomassariella vexata TaxID=1141098 RepID=A0A1Y2E7X4_9PEZI|nr:uncharacterized protein BCR38DRAFT_456344 [Pseudomassariella vexata]ORY67650.1 hypothetical protein BCR38DRAFT_456344 [Pseudomassariella vexata]